MGKVDDLFNESNEEFFERSRKKINKLPKNKDNRTQANKDRDAALKAESDGWARSRAENNKAQQDAIIRAHQRNGVSKPRGSN